jgi:DMSO/TMAO reductase YedYZ molybdopterin-dependent catalytic subunit
MCAFVIFIVLHVSLVVITGFARNMNHIVIGTDDTRRIGLYLGLLAIGVVFGINALAYWAAWKRPRAVQHAAKAVVTPAMNLLLNRASPQAEFRAEDISPYFWANGKLPTCQEWKDLAAHGFKDYRLKVHGLVENPMELSLDDLRARGKKTQITLHHCIQGWSGIAEWGGMPLVELIQLVRPKPEARAVVFYSFGDGAEGGRFYDSLSIENAAHPLTLLAYEMNFKPLVRQRDFVARLSSTQKKMEVESSRHLPKLRAQRNQELGIGPLDQLRRQAHERPGPAIRLLRGRD